MVYKILLQTMIPLSSVISSMLLIAIFLIHPNDSRISMPLPSSDNTSQKKRLKVAHRLFQDLDFTIRNSENRTQQAAEFIKDISETHTLIKNSKRFNHPEQLYISLGSFPQNLEGRDAVWLQGGSKIVIPPTSKNIHTMTLGWSPWKSRSSLRIDNANKTFSTDVLPPPRTRRKVESFWHQNFFRFLIPDFEPYGGKWSDLEIPINPSKSVQIHCLSENEGSCIISEPFLLEANNKETLNTVLILVDTLRYDFAKEGNAPNTEEFFKNSLHYKNAIALGNMTGPSTNGLLTGRLPSEIESIAFSYAISKQLRESFYESHTSFPKLMKNEGYKTAMIGNISILSEVLKGGINHGFDQQIAIEREAYDTPLITKNAIKWIRKNQSNQFFLYLHYHGPHGPYRAPWKDVKSTFPDFFTAYNSHGSFLRWLYQSEIRFTDRYLGLLYAELKKSAHDTKVILTSDHGDHHTDHYFIDNEAGLPFKGAYFDHGATLLNDEIKVPLLIRTPDEATIKKPILQYVSTQQISASLVSSKSPGNSVVPDLPKSDRKQNNLSLIAAEGYRARMIIFDQKFKYIRSYEPTKKRMYTPFSYRALKTEVFIPEQLYNLEKDPYEKSNLTTTRPKLLRKARLLFEKKFKIKHALNLTVINNEEAKIQVKVVLNSTSEEILLSIPKQDKKTIVLDQHSSMVKVLQDETPIPILSSRFALRGIQPNQLPIEHENISHFPEKKSYAILQKKSKDLKSKRKIARGNPFFEKIFRQWGYLDD